MSDKATLKRDLLFHAGSVLDRIPWQRCDLVDFAVRTFPLGDDATGYLLIPIGDETVDFISVDEGGPDE